MQHKLIFSLYNEVKKKRIFLNEIKVEIIAGQEIN